MNTILQLNPPIPLITPKGKGFAHLAIDYSQEHDLQWAVFQDDTGECWTWRNSDVRLQANVTMGRPVVAATDDRLGQKGINPKMSGKRKIDVAPDFGNETFREYYERRWTKPWPISGRVIDVGALLMEMFEASADWMDALAERQKRSKP